MAHKKPINRDATEKYIEEIVLPTIADFEANPTSRRHGFLAAVATFHTLDYMYGKDTKKSKRKNFRDQSKSFAVVDRVAHAFKHLEGGSQKDTNNQPLSEREVIRRPPAAIGEFAIGISRIGDEIGGVTLHNNVEIGLLDTLKDAVKFLIIKLNGTAPEAHP